MDSPNYQFATGTEYKDGDGGTGAWAIKPGPDAIPEVPAVPGDAVRSENFDGTLWTEISFGSGDWFATSAQSHSAPMSYTNKDIDNSETSEFIIYNDYFQEQISFWLRTETETNFDFFRLFIDGSEVYTQSGVNDWYRVVVPTGFGYEFKFQYTKDSSSSLGDDSCWVDDIVFGTADTPAIPGVPARPFVYTPLKMTDDGERLKVDAGVVVVTLDEPIDVNVLSIPEVEIKNDSGNPIPVSGTVTITDGSGPVTVDGTVAVTQSTSPWVVSGTVTATNSGGTLANGAETAVGAAAVQVLAANASRKKLIVQNTGIGDVRIGVSGVTATTGVKLIRNGSLLLDMPDCPTQAIFAIRDGAVSSTVLAQEVS